MAYIKGISYYLPEQTLTTEQLSKDFGDEGIEQLAKTAGVNIRHIAAPDETAGDMAVKAADKLFEQFGIMRKDVGFLLFCSQSSDYAMPSTSCIIQDKLGLSTTIGALTYDLGCSGYVYGLALANSLVEMGGAENVLLLTADTISKYMNPTDKNRLLFGDAATATLIAKDGCAEIGKFEMGTDGSGYEHIIIRNGGCRHKLMDGTKYDWFEMDGEAVFKFTVERLPKLINGTLEKNRIEKDDVDYFVFHQANKFMLNTLRKVNKIPKERFYVNLEESGNTTSSTVPIGLAKSMQSSVIHHDMNVMIAGFGVGLSWAGTILKF